MYIIESSTLTTFISSHFPTSPSNQLLIPSLSTGASTCASTDFSPSSLLLPRTDRSWCHHLLHCQHGTWRQAHLPFVHIHTSHRSDRQNHTQTPPCYSFVIFPIVSRSSFDISLCSNASDPTLSTTDLCRDIKHDTSPGSRGKRVRTRKPLFRD